VFFKSLKSGALGEIRTPDLMVRKHESYRFPQYTEEYLARIFENSKNHSLNDPEVTVASVGALQVFYNGVQPPSQLVKTELPRFKPIQKLLISF
jgi:hypothetical protein